MKFSFIKMCAVFVCLGIAMGPAQAQQIGDGPIIENHMVQEHIERGNISFYDLLDHGEKLFVAKFNTYDGQSRPGTTGTGDPREAGSAPRFIRTSAPDANSCAGCHNDPVIGAAGDIVANVFVLAQALDPVTDSVSGMFSNNRNTLGMHGSGPIEMLAREMTADMHHIRDMAASEASANGNSVTKRLVTKGVSFGTITVAADGTVDTSGVEGVDADLIVKPFHQKGVVTSLRQFSNNAMNHHHGIQTVERFGELRTGTKDFDQDGVEDEMSVGDVTAITVWQAALGTPGQVIPNDLAKARAVIHGERIFSNIGCADCHVSELILDNPSFSEPNPYNPDGNLGVNDVLQPYTFDMTEKGIGPRLERRPDGRAVVRAYTDLKRHNLCDEDYNHFCNEEIEQDGVATELFLTRKLWDAGNTAPYGHVGDVTTLTEAIYHHGGDARAQRDAFFALADLDQAYVIEFMKSLQILPDDAEGIVVDEAGKSVSKAALVRQHTGVATREAGSRVNLRRQEP